METSRPRIVIVGSGNVASHIAPAMQRLGDVVQVVSRHINHAEVLAKSLGVDKLTDDLSAIVSDAHYYILAVADDAIPQIAQATPDSGVWVHTSGSTPLDSLSRCKTNAGVIYPLHSFTKGVEVDWTKVPLFVEGSSPEVANRLYTLALGISPMVRMADSAERKQLHIAAVIACNFANYMWDLSASILKPLGVGFDALKPLVQNMLEKAAEITPHQAMTGPARRGDRHIIDDHIARLPEDMAQVYSMISHNIMKSYEQDQL